VRSSGFFFFMQGRATISYRHFTLEGPSSQELLDYALRNMPEEHRSHWHLRRKPENARRSSRFCASLQRRRWNIL